MLEHIYTENKLVIKKIVIFLLQEQQIFLSSFFNSVLLVILFCFILSLWKKIHLLYFFKFSFLLIEVFILFYFWASTPELVHCKYCYCSGEVQLTLFTVPSGDTWNTTLTSKAKSVAQRAALMTSQAAALPPAWADVRTSSVFIIRQSPSDEASPPKAVQQIREADGRRWEHRGIRRRGK